MVGRDAMRFANWLNNGQGGGDTETGAYTLLGGLIFPSNRETVMRNAEAIVVLPTENEWYKASFVDNSDNLAAAKRGYQGPTAEFAELGFRLVMIPEPGTGSLVIGGLLGFAGSRKVRPQQ